MKRIVLLLLLLWALPVVGKDRSQPTRAECRQFHTDLAAERAQDYALALWTEGEARFDGYCFPKDIWRGLDLIERAIANGAEGAAITLRLLHGELENAGGIEKWTPLAALALYDLYRDRVSEVIDGTRIPADVLAEWRGIVDSLASVDVERIVGRLDALAARAPILDRAEAVLWMRASVVLGRASGLEWNYQYARGVLTERRKDQPVESALRSLHLAADCGHSAAARDQVLRFLADLPIHGRADWVVRSLAQVRHATGHHADLLELAERKLGARAYRDERALIEDLQLVNARCRDYRR